MSVTQVDFSNSNIKTAFILVSENIVLMSYDCNEISYDKIHMDYITYLATRTSLDTNSADEFFKIINSGISQFINTCIYKIKMPMNVFIEIEKLDDSTRFEYWLPHVLPFSLEEIKDYSATKNGQVDFLKLS